MRETRQRIARAVTSLAAARLVVLRDEIDDLGALVLDASAASSSAVAFMVRHTSGFLTAAMPGSVLHRLRIPASPSRDRIEGVLDYGVSVDGRDTGTGISASARAETLRRLGDPACDPHDLVRPGHVMTVRVGPADLGAAGALPAAAAELVRLCGGEPVAAYAHLIGHAIPSELAGSMESTTFAHRFGLDVVDVDDVREYVGAGDTRLLIPGASPMSAAG